MPRLRKHDYYDEMMTTTRIHGWIQPGPNVDNEQNHDDEYDHDKAMTLVNADLPFTEIRAAAFSFHRSPSPP